MNGLHEKHYLLQNAIEAFVTHLGTERERAVSAMRELGPLKTKDFPEHLEASNYGQIEEFGKQLRSGTISDDGLKRLLCNIWALYKSVSASRDAALRSAAQ
ncbi:hypothetical protein [Pseudomonas chlororaphis]|uniref:hypothetical protein n=1 Tax=Pseudomonas chlororaphis TaxID=587753 RepID=UPI000F55C311|nr:hypothetical protein [Pseudomonas chlororaphis]